MPMRNKKQADLQEKDQIWPWELMGLVISTAALLAIIVVVSTHHGKPPPAFPLGVTINAIVAVFSTIVKTSMLYCAAEAISQSKWIWFRQDRDLVDLELYDQASRGPWGALNMLRHVHWRDPSAFGAIVIILSLGIDPFAQQIVHLVMEHEAVPNQPIVQTQWFYRAVDSFISDASVLYSTIMWGPDPRLLETPYVCTTGNCSWRPYETLAMCSTCADISSQIKITDWCLDERGDSCDISTPGGPTISVTLGIGGNLDWWRGDQIILNTTSTTSLLNITGVGLSVFNFTRLYLSSKPHDIYHPLFENCNAPHSVFMAGSKTRSRCLAKLRSLARADECSLFWCVHQYSAMANPGNFTETFLNAWWNYSIPNVPGRPFVAAPTYLLTLDSTFEETVEPRYPASYFIELESHVNLGKSFSRLFDTSISSAQYQSNIDVSNDTLDINNIPTDDDPAVTSRLASLTFGSPSDVNAIIPETDRIPQTFSNIASGITQLMRQNVFAFDGAEVNLLTVSNSWGSIGTQSNASVTGTAIKDVTVVRVRWAWLALPTVLLLMTMILTISTKSRSSLQTIPTWRSSTIPLMMYGPYSCVGDLSEPHHSLHQMERLAKRTKASFQPTAGGWRLVARNTLTKRDTLKLEPSRMRGSMKIPSNNAQSGHASRRNFLSEAEVRPEIFLPQSEDLERLERRRTR